MFLTNEADGWHIAALVLTPKALLWIAFLTLSDTFYRTCLRAERLLPSAEPFVSSRRSNAVFQLSSLFCVSFYYRAVVQAQWWTHIQSSQTRSLQHILSCPQRHSLFEFCHLLWINSLTLAWIRNDGATEATFGLLMSQSKLFKLISSFVMKNERLVFDTVGRTNKEKFALIRKISEPCSRI